MIERTYQAALGIETGDIVWMRGWGVTNRTYEVWSIWGPSYVTGWINPATMDGIVVRDYPVISLLVVDVGTIPKGEHDFRYINNISRDEHGWRTDWLRTRVYVEKPAERPFSQVDLFAPATVEAEPYAFDPGVDYEGDVPAWKCSWCDRDFNAPYRDTGGTVKLPPPCVYCHRYGTNRIHFLRRADLPSVEE